MSLDINIMPSPLNIKNTAYVHPFSYPPNEPEPLSKDNQQNQSNRTTKAITLILMPPSPMTQTTEIFGWQKTLQ